MDYFKVVDIKQSGIQRVVDQFITQAYKLCRKLNQFDSFAVN